MAPETVGWNFGKMRASDALCGLSRFTTNKFSAARHPYLFVFPLCIVTTLVYSGPQLTRPDTSLNMAGGIWPAIGALALAWVSYLAIKLVRHRRFYRNLVRQSPPRSWSTHPPMTSLFAFPDCIVYSQLHHRLSSLAMPRSSVNTWPRCRKAATYNRHSRR